MHNGVKMREGYGILIQPYREEYKGKWKMDKMHGEGAYRYTSGAFYQGDWENGMAHGKVLFFLFRESMNSKTEVFMMAFGRIITCMEKDASLIKMEINGKENL
jgi:hypothetical protein